MDRGFTAVGAKLDSVEGQDAGALLKLVASTLISTVGGAAGPSLRHGVSAGRCRADGQRNGHPGRLRGRLECRGAGYQRPGQGHHRRKDDARCAGACAGGAGGSGSEGLDLPEAFARAADAAEAGAKATIPLLATKGRASYLGERSIGHQDPGATSSALMLRAVADTLAQA